MSLVNRRVIYPNLTQLPELFFNKGSIGVLKNIYPENLLLLVSKSVSESELFEKLINKTLKSKKVRIEKIQDARQETILRISTKYQSWPPDAVIALGGGVVLDSAKLIRNFISFPEDSFETLSKQFVSTYPSVKLVSIPSTPNTGSESNIIAVAMNEDGKKIPYVNKTFLPNMAILDPVLLQSIPLNLMNDCVSDIMTHAYEGSISRLSNYNLQNMALNAVEQLEQGIEKYRKNKDDVSALELIHMAGHQSGIVAGNAFVGVIHALGHSLETLGKVTHGSALHSIFKQCLEWEKLNNPDKSKEAEFYLEKWQTLGLDKSADYKILESIDTEKWVELSINDPSIKTDPIKFTNDKLQEVISWIQTNH